MPTTPFTFAGPSSKPLPWLATMGLFMQTFDPTIVSTALPVMTRSLSGSPLKIQPIIIAYTLTTAVLMLVSGWLVDRFGMRKVLFAAIFLFTIGSLLCTESRGLTMLTAPHVAQGMGSALLMPVRRLTVPRVVSREQLLPAMSFATIPGLIGPLVGSTLGGWLVEAVSWRWIFLANIPVGVIGALVTLKVMPGVHAENDSRFDWSGYLVLAFGTAAVSPSPNRLSELDFQYATVLVLLTFGLAALAACWLHAGRMAGPLLPRTLFGIPSFSIGMLGNLLARTGSGGMSFLVPLLLQVSLGYTPLQVGLVTVPVVAAGMAVKPLGTWAIKHYGYYRMLSVNTATVSLMMASFATMTPSVSVWLCIVQLVISGMFSSVRLTAMNTLTLEDLTGLLVSMGSNMLLMVMMLLINLGVAVAGALLTGFTDFTVGPGGCDTLAAFHRTLVCVGVTTYTTTQIFAQLSRFRPTHVVKWPEMGVH